MPSGLPAESPLARARSVGRLGLEASGLLGMMGGQVEAPGPLHGATEQQGDDRHGDQERPESEAGWAHGRLSHLATPVPPAGAGGGGARDEAAARARAISAW